MTARRCRAHRPSAASDARLAVPLGEADKLIEGLIQAGYTVLCVSALFLHESAPLVPSWGTAKPGRLAGQTGCWTSGRAALCVSGFYVMDGSAEKRYVQTQSYSQLSTWGGGGHWAVQPALAARCRWRRRANSVRAHVDLVRAHTSACTSSAVSGQRRPATGVQRLQRR